MTSQRRVVAWVYTDKYYIQILFRNIGNSLLLKLLRTNSRWVELGQLSGEGVS